LLFAGANTLRMQCTTEQNRTVPRQTRIVRECQHNTPFCVVVTSNSCFPKYQAESNKSYGITHRRSLANNTGGGKIDQGREMSSTGVKLETGKRLDWFEPVLNIHTDFLPFAPQFFTCASSTQ